MTVKHADIVPGFIHTPFQWTYANEAARVAATDFDPGDVLKIALDEDTGNVSVLESVDGDGNATWQLVAPGAPVVKTIAYAAAITPAPALDGRPTVFEIGPLTGAMTIHAPVAPIDGQVLDFEFAQDGTGGHVVTFDPAGFIVSTDAPSALDPTAANKTWRRRAAYNAAKSKYEVLAIARF